LKQYVSGCKIRVPDVGKAVRLAVRSGEDLTMSSLVLDVLKAWRDALRFVEDNPSSPMRGVLERRCEQLRALYQALAMERERLPESAGEAERLIQDTAEMLRDADEPVAVSDGEWY
jgi:hypothetical protein